MRRFIAFALSSTLVLQAAPLMAAPALRGVRTAGSQQGLATGALSGTAQTPAGQTLANYTVQARNLENGQVAASSTTNGAGGFSFGGLSPASYVVEIVDSSGKIIGSSAATSVGAGTTATVAVSATTAAATAGAGAAAGAPAAGGGMGSAFSTALIVTTVAVAAGVAGVVVVARDEASPSR
jgi:hypothetical protein